MTTLPPATTLGLKTAADFPRYAPGLPVLGPTLGVIRDPLNYHLRAHAKFGGFYRNSFWGKESLCLFGLEANEFIWRNSELWSYGTTRASFREQFGDNYLTQLDGKPHKKKRMRLNPSFRPDFLMSGTPAMNATAVEDLAKIAGRTVDLRDFCYRLLLHMTTKGMLGLDIPLRFENAILLVEHNLLFSRLFGPYKKYLFGRPAYRRAKAEVMEYLGQLVDLWSSRPDEAPEMYRLATRMPEGEPPLSREELMGDIYLLLTGGLNSNANLILWTLLYVFHRPDWLEQLKAEVDAHPPDQFTAMKQWPKIKATIMEIERLRPATPLNVVVPTADFEFQGIAFKKGEPITHFVVLPHFLPEIYDEPHSFRPERFLGETSFPAKAHGTFGGGAHGCIGMPLARLQSPLILANILYQFDLQFLKRPSFRPRLSAAMTPVEKRIEVRVVTREHAA
jgi:cytochrome P450